MRYLVAFGFGCLLVGASFAYHKWALATIGGVLERARTQAGLAPDTNLNDFNIPLTR